jgi:carbonic anhydrase
MIPALGALARLREGNRRFVVDQTTAPLLSNPARRAALVAGQAPFAIVLGCSDGRVPAELVFDQGIGDLFVVRVAGHIVAPSQVGSVEFAAARFGTGLGIVMGHSQCGAVSRDAGRAAGTRLHPIAHLPLHRGSGAAVGGGGLADRRADDLDALVREAVRANVRASAAQLRHGSELLERLIREGGLLVVGAEYALESGVVAFVDGVPEAG